MRAIVLSFCWLTLLPAADVHQDIVDLFASMTAALTADPPNAAGFMAPFDRTMESYDQLKGYLQGLVRDWDVASSIDFLKDEGDGAKRSVDLDWYMNLTNKLPDGPAQQRRDIIHCVLLKEGKKWRIVSISPMAFFHP
jgi:hypothetical protein